MGDLNARVENDAIMGVKQRFNEATINDNGKQLIDICSRNEMRLNNTFFQRKEQYKFTFNNIQGQKSMTDFIITK